MYTTNMYKYRKNGIVYVGGDVPDEAEILETMCILNAEEKYTLIRKQDNENVGSSVWLHDSDLMENYNEKRIE